MASSDKEVGRQLCKAMCLQLDEDKGRRATYLGCDFAAGGVRRAWHCKSKAKKRKLAMAARMARVDRLRRAGGGSRTRSIVVAGLLPQGTYAAEVHGLSDSEWTEVRFAGLEASSGTRNGQSWRRHLLIEGGPHRRSRCAPL